MAELEIRPEMRSDEENWKIRQRTLRAAREKAASQSINERAAMRRVRIEEKALFRVYPDKESVAKHFLAERSEIMRERDWWYRYHIPQESSNHEVTLQLWCKPQGEEPSLVAEVGDLYNVSLELTDGTININIIVESSEARSHPELSLQYSVFDCGDGDKAFVVSAEAWFNFLMFRDEIMVPGIQELIDPRMLFHAIGNRWVLGEVTLVGFEHVTLNDCIRLKQDMVPGQWYPRPTAEESLLTVTPKNEFEGLRSEDSFRMSLEENIKFQNKMNKLRRRPKRKPRRQPSVEGLNASPGARGLDTPKKPRLSGRFIPSQELTPSKLKGVRDLLTDLVNPWSADHIEAQAESLKKYQALKDLKQGPSSPWRHKAQSPEPTTPEALMRRAGKGWTSEKSSPCSTPNSWTSFNRSEAEAMGPSNASTESPNQEDVAEDEVAGPDQKMSTDDLIGSMSGIESITFSLDEETPEVNSSPNVSLGIGQGGTPDPSLVMMMGPEVLNMAVAAAEAANVEAEVVQDEMMLIEEDVDFDDSVEIFLAKQRRESEIVTVSSSESSVNTSTRREYGDSSLTSSPMTPSLASLYEEDPEEVKTPPTAARTGSYVDDLVKFDK